MIKRQQKIYVLFVLCLFSCLSSCASKPEEQKPDLLRNTSWISTNDGSHMVFESDGSFAWYQTKGKTDDNYFAGTYEFYIGRSAMDYLANDLSEYGITEEKMQAYFDMNSEYSLDNLVCLSTTNQSFMLGGEEQLSEPKKTSYFGFMLGDGTFLDIANMITGTYYGFSKE